MSARWFYLFFLIYFFLFRDRHVFSVFSTCNMTLVFVVPFKSMVYTDMHIVGPAIEIGIEKVRNTVLSQCDFKVIMPKDPYQSSCDGIEANIASVAAEMYYSKINSPYPISAFFGLTCTFANLQLLGLLNHWNLPLLEGSSIASFLADRVRYPTLLGFSYTQTRAGRFFYETVHLFGWTDVSIMYDADDAVWRALFTAMDYFKTKPLIKTSIIPFYLKSRGVGDIERVVLEAHQNSRVNLVLGNPGTIRNVMIYISGAYFKTKNYFGIPKWNASHEDADVIREAFKSLFLVKQQIPSSPEFHQFDVEVQKRAIQEYNESIVPDNEVNVHAMGFHDAILTYATVIREVFEDKDNIFDGRAVSKRFTGRTFKGIRGELTPDKYNNLNGNFELWNFLYEKGDFVKVVDFPETAEEPLIVNKISWALPNGPPPNRPVCGFSGDDPVCSPSDQTAITDIIVAVLVIGMIVSTTFFIIWIIKKKHDSADRNWWKIEKAEVSRVHGNYGIYQFQPVFLKNVPELILNKSIIEELKQIRTMKCAKIVHIIGITIDNQLVQEYCSRGSVYHLVRNEDQFIQDWRIKASVLTDLTEGLIFIHQSWIHCHGRLRSSKCLINSQFIAKISDFALQSLFPEVLTTQNKFWKAPEFLRNENQMFDIQSKKMGDVYSLGIIFSEILLMENPYNGTMKHHNEILELIIHKQHPPFRPDLRNLKLEKPYDALRPLVQKCWKEEPRERATVYDIQNVLKKAVNPNQKSLVEEIMDMLANYTGDLENLVMSRTTELVEEKKKIQQILFEILPRSVALDLVAGIAIEPEMFESATVLFSAIEGFADIVAKSLPIEVLGLLQNTCSTIDHGIPNFDVYKVETITDTYMIVSGVPLRNGNRHVSEIARCALYFRNVASQLRMEFKTHYVKPKFLIGFHTGCVMTGVIGRKMPRYCLFGDTINTASRMETTSQGGKIQLSQTSMSLLQQTTNFSTEARGEIFVKGKGNMNTFWLLDKPRMGSIEDD